MEKRHIVITSFGIIAFIIGILIACIQVTMETESMKQEDLVSCREENKELKVLLRKKFLLETTAFVTVTFYHPPSGGINSYGDPNKTATMSKPIPGWTIAVSTSLFEKGWLGKEIYINGFGMFKAHSRMNTDLPGDRIDICVGSLEDIPPKGIFKEIYASVIR